MPDPYGLRQALNVSSIEAPDPDLMQTFLPDLDPKF
jgi:hypothetical protein